MISKTILGAITIAFVAAGSLGASALSAAAHDFNGGYGGSGNAPNCKPIFNRVAWYDDWGNLHFSNQYLGEKCWPVADRRRDEGGDWNGRRSGGDRHWDNGEGFGRRGGDRSGRWDNGFSGGGGWTFRFGFGG
jgi:hypothetical protein